MNLLSNGNSVSKKESYFERLARLVSTSHDPKDKQDFKTEMTPDEAAEIMSDNLIETVKRHFQKESEDVNLQNH